LLTLPPPWLPVGRRPPEREAVAVAERVIGFPERDATAPLPEGDRLFMIAEDLSRDFSLFPERVPIHRLVRGLLDPMAVKQEVERLKRLDVDAYIERCVAPAEAATRASAPSVIRRLGKVLDEESHGPYYAALLQLDFFGETREVGFIAQDRSVRNGMWLPEHHARAAQKIDECARRARPIVSFMDTPGADAEEAANRANQAHQISRLIAEACNVDMPTLGVIFGLGYSGGAIPFAAANLILSVRDGVFSTIQPRGLASIARRFNLSWQECAKHVGVSAVELCQQGCIDGVIDYSPAEPDERLENLRLAIVTGVRSVEDRVREFVGSNPYIVDHYRRSIQRYLSPSERLRKMQASASLSLTSNPTEYMNVFGVAFRYLRYLGLRKRLRSTTTAQYGRLAREEVPVGQLDARIERERRRAFLGWLQDPEKVVYDDDLAKAWRTFRDRKAALADERSRFAQLFLGEPRRNYEEARTQLLCHASLYLYNRWKTDARSNLRTLVERLEDHQQTRCLLRVADLSGAGVLLRRLREDAGTLASRLRSRLSYEGRRLVYARDAAARGEGSLRVGLTTELNLAILGEPLATAADVDVAPLSGETRALIAASAPAMAVNRSVLCDLFGEHVPRGRRAADAADTTIVDVLLEEDLRESFIDECASLLLFDEVYDQIIANLDSIAEEADKTRALSRDSVGRLLTKALEAATRGVREAGAEPPRAERQLASWFAHLAASGRAGEHLHVIEEWKRAQFPQVADVLFVVVTVLLERLVPAWFDATATGRRFDGRITPRRIGKRKDFWNRLTIAYRDLLINNLLAAVKRRTPITYRHFLDRFFGGFEELYGDLISADPVRFPGLRQSIEDALAKGQPPCGTITGIGRFRLASEEVRVGVVLSNVAFQAGAFDMASGEKVCKLLVHCAQERLPVVCFISSSGMQTKEGAGALFSMAVVNDRVTRFIRDNDLPVIVFGYGDCTGGAQASFVTHPLVQTYYFSGTSMPFAGQIVVPSNLPSTAILSNYLSQVPGSMQGLVRHPFVDDLDDALRRIDPDVPVARESVGEVVERVLEGRLAGRRPEVRRVGQPSPRDLLRPVRRVLVHARGCTAVKLIDGAHARGIDVVLVQSDPDMESVAVDMLRQGDRAVCIGGNTPDESYLNAMSVVRVAEHEQVDAVHPGIGFLSENAQFAELCRNHRLNFIGPPVGAMEAMGNKSNAIATARRLGVAVVPGSHGILTDPEHAADVADGIGFPVLIKAVHGGGGKGIQVVQRREDFHELFLRVQAEARNAFGNPDVYLEKFVTRLRHIEVQVLRDIDGNTCILGLRDCSVQRDKQKVLEESASTALPELLAARVFEYARQIADDVRYLGAGTVEFIYDLDAGSVYFMEMNTRLQVEHPVTEAVTGIDIVGEQFRIAAGESIAGLRPRNDGHAIEARINAERVVADAAGNVVFRPDPGRVTACDWPSDARVQVISTIAAGKSVPPYYDSLVAQVIAHGDDRDDALDRLATFLASTRIEGVSTNIPVVLAVLADPMFRAGDFDTGYLPALLSRLDVQSLQPAHAGGAGATIDRAAIAIEGSDELKVLAPGSGIFYVAAAPNDPAYVSVGDVVGVEDVLCQIEAMKIFSPLRLADFGQGDVALYAPELRYEVTRVNLANGQQVNKGDLLFVVRVRR
jgi:acetyl/propionyl-CoA carboxylase alpha subunit